MNTPATGFYYHYKHTADGPVNNYAYEVLGTGHHTEEENSFFVVYRPLYEAFVYKLGKFFDIRPLNMFIEEVTKDGKTFPRFQKITDQNIISQLEKIKEQMYGI